MNTVSHFIDDTFICESRDDDEICDSDNTQPQQQQKGYERYVLKPNKRSFMIFFIQGRESVKTKLYLVSKEI